MAVGECLEQLHVCPSCEGLALHGGHRQLTWRTKLLSSQDEMTALEPWVHSRVMLRFTAFEDQKRKNHRLLNTQPN